jgi:tRNA-Thr(GGU) m(6)t(6)A37 methyltransferase TsaA
MSAGPGTFTFEAIGVVRSPFVEKVDAPRQAAAAVDVEGTIELFPGRDLEHAVEDLASWGRIWVVFVFDRAGGWRPKVLPPRSDKRRGVLSTRSPHRPNPIGLSAVRLVGIEGLTLRIRDVDILDGSPVLDVKPYVPYADAFPDAGSGWLDAPADPIAPQSVTWTGNATSEAHWLKQQGIDVVAPVERTLALGAKPSAYRRIRRVSVDGGSEELELAVKDWRVRLRTAGTTIIVTRIRTGYKPRELAIGEGPGVELARAFVAEFGDPQAGDRAPPPSGPRGRG